MSLLANLKTDDSIGKETDSVGGNGPVESGAYLTKIAMAYLEKSKGGALSLVLHLDNDGKDIRQVLWIQSGDAKGNKNYYENKQGEKNYLPGFNMANSMSLLTIGKELGELTTETKVVSIYNFESRAEVPTSVEVVTALLGQEIIAGILKQTVDKNKNVAAEGQPANYQPTGESRDENELDKFFRAADKLTTAEILAGVTEAAFYTTWCAKHTGNTRDRQSDAGKAMAGGGAVPAFGSPAASAAAKPAATSLFAT